MRLARSATVRSGLRWHHLHIARKGQIEKRGTAMSAVYPRLYPTLFFGLIALKGYLLLML